LRIFYARQSFGCGLRGCECDDFRLGDGRVRRWQCDGATTNSHGFASFCDGAEHRYCWSDVSGAVTALDSSGATVTGYGGTVHFSSSDSRAVLPPDLKLSAGAGGASATLHEYAAAASANEDHAEWSGIAGVGF
jgi:hypothetical protein